MYRGDTLDGAKPVFSTLLLQHRGAVTAFHQVHIQWLTLNICWGRGEPWQFEELTSEKLPKAPTERPLWRGASAGINYRICTGHLKQPTLSPLAWLHQVGPLRRPPFPQTAFKYPRPQDSAAQSHTEGGSTDSGFRPKRSVSHLMLDFLTCKTKLSTCSF